MTPPLRRLQDRYYGRQGRLNAEGSAEQLIRNQQVTSSNLVAGSIFSKEIFHFARCRLVALIVGSNWAAANCSSEIAN